MSDPVHKYAYDAAVNFDTLLGERIRQIRDEGFDPESDMEYIGGELAFAAACYCIHAGDETFEPIGLGHWPLDASWWKPGDARRNLVKAGALIMAEIERLDRQHELDIEEAQAELDALDAQGVVAVADDPTVACCRLCEHWEVGDGISGACHGRLKLQEPKPERLTQADWWCGLFERATGVRS